MKAIAPPALLAKGCVDVVGLDGLKNQAGNRWPRICDDAYRRLESLFRAKLGPTDFFLKIADDAYLVAMPASDPEDVDIVCLRVAYDLHLGFLDQCEPKNIQVGNASSGADDTLIVKPLTPERIAALAEKAGIQDLRTPGDAPRESGPTLVFAPPDRTVCAAGDTALPQRTDRGTLRVEHHFVPIWSVPNAAVTTYACQAKTIVSSVLKEPVTMAMLSPKERIQIELSCLHAGIAQIARSARRGSRFLLAVPMSFEVLGSPAGRMELLSACRNLFGEHRQYLVFIISEVPPGVGQTRLCNMVNMLRPFGRDVSATVAPHARVYSAYQGIGLRAIGFSLREFTDAFRCEDADSLVRYAKAMNLGTFLSSIEDRRTLRIARSAGIQNLSGPAVAPPCVQPRGMRRFTWEDTACELPAEA